MLYPERAREVQDDRISAEALIARLHISQLDAIPKGLNLGLVKISVQGTIFFKKLVQF